MTEITLAAMTAVPQPHHDLERTSRIRALNDEFRRQLTPRSKLLGRYVKTRGVDALLWGTQFALKELIKLSQDFTEASDPHGEHDFGRVAYKGTAVLWKIDYYSPDLQQASPDPSDPAQCQRVLTVMLPSEY